MSSNETRVARAANRSRPKNKRKGAYERPSAQCHGVVLRTPLLPVDTMVQWSEGTTAARVWSEGGDVEAAIEHDLAQLRERLQATVRRPEVREAIFLASPAVAEGLDAWTRDPTSKQGRDLERSLTRYVTRMCTRATPFGLFSGCSVGGLGEATRAELSPQEQYRRSIDLDADAIGAMVRRLVEHPRKGWAGSRLHTNTTLVEVDGGYHYAEWRDGESGRSYDLSRVPIASPLRAVIDRARDGATTEELLVALRTEVPDLADDEGLDFIEELVVNKILTSELEPAVTGVSPTEGFARALDQSDPRRAACLTEARKRLDALNASPLGATPDQYAEVRNALGDLLGDDHRQWLHGKLYKPTRNLALGPDVTEPLEAATSRLERLAAPGRPLGDFAERLQARNEGKFVPLLEALDPDGGIGFGRAGRDATPLLDGLPLGRLTAPRKSLGLFEQRLASLLARRGHRDGVELDLDDAQLERLTEDLPAAAKPGGTHSFAAMFTVADPTGDGEAPELVLTMSGGTTGSMLLGRFCQSEPQIEDLVRRNLAAEEANAEVVYAEIAHSPEGRHANVIARPVLRGYEIPYLGRSGAPPDRQIRVSDLEVGVRHGRVVLRSRRLGREVVPRLTCAHSAAGSSLPVYRFLTALAAVDASPSASWSWGSVLPTLFDFLPRVRIAGVVVSRASWFVRRDEAEGLQSPDVATQFAAAQALRKRRGLPRWVSHGVSDRLVVVDLDNCLCVAALAHAIRDQERFELTEVYPQPERCFARGPEGRFVSEMIAPMTREVGPPRPCRAGPSSTPAIGRSFGPGSEWLYARLYSGCAGVDRLVQQIVGPVMRHAEAVGLVDRWFFLRFADPDWHVRLRAHGDPRRLQLELLPLLQQALATGGHHVSCWKTELGTYEREVERYGGAAGIQVAEALFHQDSIHAARCLAAIGGDPTRRWQATLAGLDATLAALGMNLESRLEVVTLACDSMANELSLGKPTEQKLSKRFREHRAVIDQALGADPGAVLGEQVAAAVNGLRGSLRDVGERYADAERRGALEEPLTTIAVSLIHMHANRMFRSDARPQEYVLYDFLRRHYRSAIGRARKQSKHSKA